LDWWHDSRPHPVAAHLDRRVCGGGLAGVNHLRLTIHPLTKNKNQRGGDDEWDGRAHGSPDPHELDAPIGRVIPVGSQGFGHALADQNEAGRFNAHLDQVFTHR
jgi:hypothetical protein